MGYVRQTIIAEEDTGEIVSDVITRGSQLGKGWVVVYTQKVTDFILSCPSMATIKIFLLLAMGQQFEERGMITTKKAIQEKLGITKQTCLSSFKWLKEHHMINESKIDGYTEFMVHPDYVMVGRDKKKRQQEWTRRCSSGFISVSPEDIAPSKGSKVAKLEHVRKSRRSIE